MVYAPPSAAPSSDASSHTFRQAHRRTRSHNVTSPPNDTSAAAPHGAFAPMAHIPRRKNNRKAFYLEDEPPSPEPEEEDGPSPLSPLAIDTNVHAFPSIPASYDRNDPSGRQSVPFPRTSSDTFSPPPVQRPPFSPRPSFSRSPSSPVIVLSNGKPLKPSLKSSQSAPHIPDELRPHMRTKSEPSTPSVKSVHFRDDDEIEDVKVYNRQGRPANLLVKPGEETETETEVESAFPFPRTMGGTGPTPPSPVAPPADQLPFEIDNAPGKASPVPRPTPETWANVHLEAVSLPRTRPAAIRGSVLVRNVVFEKNVVVRFTLDDWQTTSEVVCRHVVSMPGLPPPFPPATDGHGWDRFSFQISLEDYVGKLADKTLFLVVRYGAPGHGEWWDNNAGSNYRVVFKKSPPPPPSPMAMDGLAHSQQRGFVAPSTLRATPPSVPSLANTLYASVAAPELSTPDLYPSAITGKLTASPSGSPNATPRRSPSGSPPGSDAENRKPPARRRPQMGLGLGLGVNGSSRPPALTRSMSSPPVFTPPLGAVANGFLSQAAPEPSLKTRGAPPGRQQVDGNISPLMARLSKLSLSNYSAPSKPTVPARSVSYEEVKHQGGESPVLDRAHKIMGGHYATVVPDPSAPTPEVKVTASTPPADVQTPKAPSPSITPKPTSAVRIPSPPRSASPEALVPAAANPSPENSLSTSPVATSSTSTSATSSPLLSTPLGSSLQDIPSLTTPDQPQLATTRGSLWEPLMRADSPPKRQPRDRDASNSSSDSSTSSSGTRRAGAPRTTYKSADLVLNMPTPTSRGDVNSPFSPVSTPRFSLDASLLAAGARASPNSMRSRVDTSDADYHAFVRQWCFARSPSPGNSPAGTPKDEPSAAPLHTVRVQVAVPRTDSPLHRTSPHGSNSSSPSFTPNASFERSPWLGMGEGYGLGMSRSWEAGKA